MTVRYRLYRESADFAAEESCKMVENNIDRRRQQLNMKLFHDLLESKGYDILQTRDGMEH